MAKQFYCKHCGICAQRTSNSQKYCKNCAHTLHLLNTRTIERKKRKELLCSCHMRRKADGTPDFEQEEKDVRKLLKICGLRK